MCYQKNNFFLVDLIYEISKKENDAVLLCVGTGVDEQRLKEYAKELCVDKNIKFLGVRSDVSDILCASDVFVFPSRFEGLPLTCVEAQISGLPCVLSNRIDSDVKLSDKTLILDLDVKKWAPAVLQLLGSERTSSELSEDVLSKYSFENSTSQLREILARDQI